MQSEREQAVEIVAKWMERRFSQPDPEGTHLHEHPETGERLLHAHGESVRPHGHGSFRFVETPQRYTKEAAELLALTWPDGGKPLLAVLAQDQVWPDPKYLYFGLPYLSGHCDAQIEAMKAGFRRVAQLEMTKEG